MTQGSYHIAPVNRESKIMGFPPTVPPGPPPDPASKEAVDIYFGLLDSAPQPPPKEQVDLQTAIAKVLRACQILFLEDGQTGKVQEGKFRDYYVRLYRLAQLGLEGSSVATSIASSALASVTADLIDDEAGQVKNKHLKVLANHAAWLSLPFAVAYAILCLSPAKGPVATVIVHLGATPSVLANFMLLWIGSFLGVWLSYGVRTTTFTLSDLTITDSDRLTPAIRLLFAGSLTMILGIVCVLLLDVKIGNYSVTRISDYPMLAFLFGSFCGISELLLPTAVAKRASDFVGNLK